MEVMRSQEWSAVLGCNGRLNQARRYPSQVIETSPIHRLTLSFQRIRRRSTGRQVGHRKWRLLRQHNRRVRVKSIKVCERAGIGTSTPPSNPVPQRELLVRTHSVQPQLFQNLQLVTWSKVHWKMYRLCPSNSTWTTPLLMVQRRRSTRKRQKLTGLCLKDWRSSRFWIILSSPRKGARRTKCLRT